MPPVRRLAAIMFADIAGYTSMMRENETEGMQRLRRFRSVLEENVAKHHGRILQHYGDGSLVLFDSAVEAVGCAKQIQLLLLQQPSVPLRIGIHVGDIVTDGDYIYGDGVNLASRVESLGVPGSILITERVIHDLRSHPQFSPISLGMFALKNVSEPMEIFALADAGIVVPQEKDLSGHPKVQPTRSGRPARRTPLWLAAGAALLALLIFFIYRLQPTADAAAQQLLEDKSIAVLPFRDLSPDSGYQYFGDGIAEDILNALARVRDLKVAGRTSSFSFRQSELNMKEIGRQLGVNFVLEGSVRRIGSKLRVTAQLVDVSTGYQTWSESFDRQVEDIFSIQDDIARAVAENLQVILLNGERTALTSNREAYEWYLRGKHKLSQRSDGSEAAVEFFERALKLDPDFAEAYAGLGNAYLWLGWSNGLPSNEAFPLARKYAHEALRRDSALAYAYSILGSVSLWHDWDWPAARQSLEKAIALNPSEAAAWLDLGWLHAVAGDFAQAIAHLEKAVGFEPLSLEYNIDLADINRMNGNHGRAREIGKAMQEVYSENSETYWLLGMVDYTEGQYAEAVNNFAQSARLSDEEDWSVMHLAMAQANAGQREPALVQLARLEKDTAIYRAAPVEMAPVLWNLDRRKAALDWLERSFEQRANWMISLRMDPLWDEMRVEPRFQKLIERMNFPD